MFEIVEKSHEGFKEYSRKTALTGYTLGGTLTGSWEDWKESGLADILIIAHVTGNVEVIKHAYNRASHYGLWCGEFYLLYDPAMYRLQSMYPVD